MKTLAQQRKINTENVVTLTSSQLNELCNDSLGESVRNFRNSINVDIIELPLAAIEKQKWFSSKESKRMNNLEVRLNDLQSSLKTSYVSNNTFAENKADLTPNQSLSSNYTQANNFLIVSNFVNHLCKANFVNNFTQVRGFKTQRAIESQLKRNPTFLSRIQHLVGKYDTGFCIKYYYVIDKTPLQ